VKVEGIEAPILLLFDEAYVPLGPAIDLINFGLPAVASISPPPGSGLPLVTPPVRLLPPKTE